MKNLFLITFILLLTNLVYCQTPRIEAEGNGSPNGDMLLIENNNYSRISSYTFSNNPSEIPALLGYKSRGTKLSPLDVSSGDRITGMFGGIYVNGNFKISSAIEYFVGEEINSNSSSSYMTFGTTNNFSNTRTEKMRISTEGFVGIGTSDPKSKLEVSNGDVYLSNSADGVILTSPNGNCWKVTISDTGSLQTTSIVCPN